MSNEMDLQAAVTALRQIGSGFYALADALGGSPLTRQARTEAVLADIPETGITVAELSEALKRAGIDPRTIGSMVRFGQLEPANGNGERASKDRIYYAGKAEQ